MSMTMIPVADARDQLSRLVNDAQTLHERFQISRNGRPAAVILAQDDYDALMETIDIMANTELIAELSQAIAEDRAGQGVTGKELAEHMMALRDRSDG